jgi:hypothetical protein
MEDNLGHSVTKKKEEARAPAGPSCLLLDRYSLQSIFSKIFLEATFAAAEYCPAELTITNYNHPDVVEIV